MSLEGGRVGAAKMSPSSGWLGLSVFRLGTDDLLAPAPRPLATLGVLREALASDRLPRLPGVIVRRGYRLTLAGFRVALARRPARVKPAVGRLQKWFNCKQSHIPNF